jgi:hypothetical protein
LGTKKNVIINLIKYKMFRKEQFLIIICFGSWQIKKNENSKINLTDEKFEKLLKFQYKMFREGQTNYLTQVYTISKGKYILYMCCTYLAISCSSEGVYVRGGIITTLVPQLLVYMRSGIL